MSNFEKDAARYMRKATDALTAALGAFIVSRETHPGIYGRLFDLSAATDDLYLDLLEACGMDEEDIEDV